MRALTTTIVLLCLGGGLTWTAQAHADSKQCLEANNQGTELRQKGKLVEAREKYLTCAANDCPKLVRDECQGLVSKLDASIPSIVFAASDARGNDVVQVKVSIDGTVVVNSLDGRAIPLNPGEHQVRFEGADGTVVERTMVAREGDKNRAFDVELGKKESAAPPPASGPPPAAAEPKSKARVSPLAYVLGGVGVIGLGSFTYFALQGKKQQDDLESSCAPHCADADYDEMKQKYLIADISLGVGVVALGAATYLFLSPSREVKAGAFAIGASATPGGAFVGARGAF